MRPLPIAIPTLPHRIHVQPVNLAHPKAPILIMLLIVMTIVEFAGTVDAAGNLRREADVAIIEAG